MPDVQMQPIPVRKPRSRTRRALEGTAVAIVLLGGLEVALHTVAQGAVSPEVKLWAQALSLGIGAVVAALRGSGMLGGLMLAVLAWGISSPVNAADRYRSYSVTLASAACPSGAPGLMSDAKEPGLSMGGLRAWNVTILAPPGETFTGTGLLRVCVFRRSPGGPDLWVPSPTFAWDFSDDGFGNPITGTRATFQDITIGVNDGDLVYVYPETTLGVSAGTTVSVYLEGQLNATP
jgi:hypothetical protein